MLDRRRARQAAALLASTLALTGCTSAAERAAAFDLALAVERSFSAFEGTPESVRLRDAARDTLSGFAARDLYEILAAGDPARSPKGILVRLEDAAGTRTLTHESTDPAPGIFDDAPSETPVPGRSIGDALLFVALRPLEQPAGALRLRVASAIRTGRGDAFWLPRAIPDALETLEKGAQAKPAANADPLVDLLRRELPATAAALERHLEIRGGVSWSAREAALRVRPTIRLRREALAADHPAFAAWVERIGGALRSETVLATPAGAPFASWRWDGLERGLSARLLARDGALLPIDGTEAASGVDLRAPVELTMSSGGSMELFGLRTTVSGIDARVAMDARREAPSLRLAMAGLPEDVAVEGRLFGLVPAFLLDLLMPGTLATSIRSSMETSFLGRDGAGILLLASSEGEGDARFASTSLFADVPGGRLTQLARSWVASATRPTPDEWSDFRRWVESVARAFRSDLADPSRPAA